MPEYKVVNSRSKQIFKPSSGEILQMELAARNIKKLSLLNYGYEAGHFCELLHGKRHVEKLLDIPAGYWMRVQVYRDLFIERNKDVEAA